MTLVDALKKFNRKERYWLLRSALGPSSQWLGKDFLQKLNQELGLTKAAAAPDDAWWAMDYHLDWLVGALQLYHDGHFDPDRALANTPNLVLGNQEDIDLLIAFDQTLIMIEAKGDSSWDTKQLHSKVARLEACFTCFNECMRNITVYYILMSSKNASLSTQKQLKPIAPWVHNKHAAQGPAYVLHLPMAEEGEKPAFLKVTRCVDAQGTVGAKGSHWKIEPIK